MHNENKQNKLVHDIKHIRAKLIYNSSKYINHMLEATNYFRP